jgi:hypothetical protein
MVFGAFLLLVMIMVAALPAVIAVEGLVLWRMLRQPAGKAFGLAARANLRALFWCIGLALIDSIAASYYVQTKSPFVPALIMLVPLFAFLWWIEHRAVARRVTELSLRQVAIATGAANLASYVLIVAAVLAFYPRHSITAAQVQISGAAVQLSNVKTAVAEYWQAHKRFPVDARDIGLGPPSGAYKVELRQGGLIAVRIVKAEHPDLQDRHVIVQPEVQADGTLRWRCFSPDIGQRLMPPGCR